MDKDKNRYWTFLVYPESAPKNWRDILQETGLQYAVSPIHDSDINDDGVVKKEHYHLIVCFPGPTTYKRVEGITELVNGTIPKRLLSIIGMYRYFTHKDNPDKYQYNENDITGINGFDINDYSQMTSSQTLAIKIEIHKIIELNNILEYYDLMNYLLVNDLKDFYFVASNNTIFIDRFISSKRNKLIEEQTGHNLSIDKS